MRISSQLPGCRQRRCHSYQNCQCPRQRGEKGGDRMLLHLKGGGAEKRTIQLPGEKRREKKTFLWFFFQSVDKMGDTQKKNKPLHELHRLLRPRLPTHGAQGRHQQGPAVLHLPAAQGRAGRRLQEFLRVGSHHAYHPLPEWSAVP